MNSIAIVGAGISGAALARGLADRGVPSTVFEQHSTLGGMCRETMWQGNLVSELGPHIFRTRDSRVWDFICRFCEMKTFSHSVETSIDGDIVPFPPLFSNTPPESRTNYESVGDYLITTVGRETFLRYYESYTQKRWGVSAFALSPDMIPLIPVYRFPSGFFAEARSGIPIRGFTNAIENMLDHSLINLLVNSRLDTRDFSKFSRIVWTGSIGALVQDGSVYEFRSVRQDFSHTDPWPTESAAVINYPGNEVPYIRRTNYRMLLPWSCNATGTEYSGDAGYPAYPLRTHSAINRLDQDLEFLAKSLPNVIPHGRLGKFAYISMDQAICESLNLSNTL